MSNEQKQTVFTITATAEDANLRIDSFIAKKLPDYSRSFLKKLFDNGHIVLNEKTATKPSTPIKLGDTITVTIPAPPPLGVPKPFEGELGVEVVYEHPDFFIVNKPAGLTVHSPRQGSETVTLVDWLLKKFSELVGVGEQERPGIVHRLDKDTSGLMIIPRNAPAHAYFSDLFKNRGIQKTYLALVKGHPKPEGTITFDIGRHPQVRHKMHSIKDQKTKGRTALTNYAVVQQFDDWALVEVKPVTGRTHQIRVHMAAIGHPLLGDAVYGSTSPLIKRQALHAHALSFEYRGEKFNFSAPAPEDFTQAVAALDKN